MLERGNPLKTTNIELGAVSSRVALLLRSAEAKPWFSDLFLDLFQRTPPSKLLPSYHPMPEVILDTYNKEKVSTMSLWDIHLFGYIRARSSQIFITCIV
jgi:hypothetical protein